MNTAIFPILGYALTSDSRSQADLRALADYDLRPAIVQFDSAHDDLGEIGACRQAGIAAMVKYFGADLAVFERIIRLKPDMINLDRADIFVAAYAKVTGKRTGLRRHLRQWSPAVG